MLSLLCEIDDLPLLVVELKVEAGLVSNPILDRGRGLGGQGPPHRSRLAKVIGDLGEHLVSQASATGSIFCKSAQAKWTLEFDRY